MFRVLAALAALFALVATPAGAVLHKAGYWDVEAIGKEPTTCGAFVKVDDTLGFALIGIRGEVSFSLEGKGVRRGKRATVEPDGETFDFEPKYDGREFMYLDDVLTDEAVAAIRVARRLRVTVDDKRIAEMVIQDTGVPEVLDAVIACSKGQEGWWGKGAKVAEREPGLNEEGYWKVAASAKGEVCTALAAAEGDRALVFIAGGGEVLFAVGGPAAARRGRKGLVELDGYSFAFTPSYDGKDYFASDAYLDSQAMVLFRRSKGVRITVDGREQLSMNLEGTGLDGALAALIACSKGEKGWWGEGAKVGA